MKASNSNIVTPEFLTEPVTVSGHRLDTIQGHLLDFHDTLGTAAESLGFTVYPKDKKDIEDDVPGEFVVSRGAPTWAGGRYNEVIDFNTMGVMGEGKEKLHEVFDGMQEAKVAVADVQPLDLIVQRLESSGSVEDALGSVAFGVLTGVRFMPDHSKNRFVSPGPFRFSLRYSPPGDITVGGSISTRFHVDSRPVERISNNTYAPTRAA